MTAKGAFDVKLTPQESPVIGRLVIAKTFHGDLEAVSEGEMLAVRTAVPGSAGYVAIEKVTGNLAGRSGSFFLQHTGTMSNGSQDLKVTVIPDSGTGDLVGLSGQMSILIENKAHFYEFTYSLK